MSTKLYQIGGSRNRSKFLEKVKEHINVYSEEAVIYRMITWFSLHEEFIDELKDVPQRM